MPSDYVDRPRPGAGALAIPALLAGFFAAMALTIAGLAVLVLPPILWIFTGPVLLLCLAGLAVSGTLLYVLTTIEYRIEGGTLTLSRGLTRARVGLDHVEGVVRSGDRPGAGAFDRSGTSSARNFANRSRGAVLLSADGEWLRLSPTSAEEFVRALEQGRRG